MTTIAITGDMTPQMIKILKEQVIKLNPMFHIDTILSSNIPTDETIKDLKNAKSLKKRYVSHNDLINEIKAEIEAE
ncbi:MULTISPECIES: hypothetical protein [Campylobacter]|uniref:hypothetical protein n=1 Tax=Campylobacter TaxID=194 RepID=UPI0023F4A420|nr:MULTISPECIES: hypothetical protein [Campylobacter]MCI6641472.1 hypothetical protein [Campylobacter sp.]MDD7422152.1 hypothetical protein [Campylobacter hominis]MDY3117813.1 hypothetical protein [Campylobacter hominis]